MKKTVFEGIINGQIYNDVQDYNNAMIELIKSGKAVNASTSTRTIDVCDESDKVNLHFGFDFDEPLADHYLSMDADNEEIMENLDKEMDKQLDGISTAIKHMNISDLNKYMKDVNTILCELKNMETANDAAMEEIETKLCFLVDSSSLHQMFIDFYGKVNSMITDKIAEIAEITNDNNCNKQIDKIIDKSVCNNECNIKTVINEITPQQENDIAKTFGKVFTDMFKGIDTNEIKKILNL